MENINKNTVYALEALTSAYKADGLAGIESMIVNWAKLAGQTAADYEKKGIENNISDDSPLWDVVSTAQIIDAEITDHMADILKAFERIEFMGIKQAENVERLNNWGA